LGRKSNNRHLLASTKSAKIVVGANNILDIYPDTFGPTTAIRPRLVNGAIDYTAAPATIYLISESIYLKVCPNLVKTEDSFLLDCFSF
jgi:hypothetical protein